MDLLAQQYEGLTELHPAAAIGEIFGLGDSRLVPFLCAGHRFLASYTPVHTQDEAASMRSIVHQDTQHVMSDHAQILKFAHCDLFFQKERFEPAPVGGEARRAIMFQIPNRIASATQKLMEFDGNADEFYFIAGGISDERIEQLDLWYRRISGKFPVETLGLEPIHPPRGSWYGYRKTRR
ncbi:hypothetical protein ACSVIJ_12280 [Pseudomonas sp. NCHU5208]|uniref:hypothetical protein n=1 Tax=unclassified Pseudomonas TaxID=196821 RepID=UPI003F94D79D